MLSDEHELQIEGKTYRVSAKRHCAAVQIVNQGKQYWRPITSEPRLRKLVNQAVALTGESIHAADLSPAQIKQKLHAQGYRPMHELTDDGLEVQFLLWNGDEVWGCLLLGGVTPAARSYYSYRDGPHKGLLNRAPLGWRPDAAAGYRARRRAS